MNEVTYGPVTFDRDRAIEVFRSLADHWTERRHPFDGPRFEPPEQRHRPADILPGSRLHACWLFFGTWLNRSGKTAEELFGKLAELYATNPELIDPLHPDSYDRGRFERLGNVIPFANIPKYRNRIDWWYRWHQIFQEKYDGDPRQMFLQINLTGDWRVDRQNLLQVQIQELGTGHKIAQLTTAMFQEVDWPEEREQWQLIRQIPMIAIDLWWGRLVYQLGLVTSYSTDSAKIVGPLIADFVCEVCFTNSILHTHLGQAKWHIGSVLCGRMRPKINFRQFCHATCPAVTYCQGLVPANYIVDLTAPVRHHDHGHIAKPKQKSSQGRLFNSAELPRAKVSGGKDRVHTTRRLDSLRWREIVIHPLTPITGTFWGTA